MDNERRYVGAAEVAAPGTAKLTHLAALEDIERAREAGEGRVRYGDGSGFNLAEMSWPEGRGPDTTPCFGRIVSGPEAGNLCMKFAGAGTDHPGIGRCWLHGGRSDEGRREAAWVVAHRFAAALDVTPWEGLLWAVRIAAGKVAFIEAKLGEAESDRQFEPPSDAAISEAGRTYDAGYGTNLNYWVKQSEFWHDRLTRVSKLAIDAGVAERLVRQIELEAALMLRATNMTLDELGLEGDVRERALAAMSRNLLLLEAEEVEGVSDGRTQAG